MRFDSAEPSVATTIGEGQPEVFTSGEVADFIGMGVDVNEVDLWVRSKLITPSVRVATGQGSRRLFARDDLRKALLIAQLRKANWKPKQILPALCYVENAFKNLDALNTPVLVHEGTALFILCRDENNTPVILDAANPKQSVMVIALDTLEEETRLRLARSK